MSRGRFQSFSLHLESFTIIISALLPPSARYIFDNQQPSNNNMPAPDLAYCSSIPGALTLLIQLSTGLIAAFYFCCIPNRTLVDQLTTLKIFLLYFWSYASYFSLPAGYLIELLPFADLLRKSTRTRLRCSLYLARISLFRFLGLIVATLAVLAMYTLDDELNERHTIGRKYQHGKPPLRTHALKFAIAVLLINLFTLLAMFLGGGIDALTMEAKMAWKTLYIAELIGLQQEWVVTNVELQGSGAEHGGEIGSSRVRFEDDGVKTPPTPQASPGDL